MFGANAFGWGYPGQNYPATGAPAGPPADPEQLDRPLLITLRRFGPPIRPPAQFEQPFVPTSRVEGDAGVHPLLMPLVLFRPGPMLRAQIEPFTPPPPFPPERVSQLAVEALVLPTSAKARVSQLAVEVLVLPTSAKERVSQVAVEALYRLRYESVEVTIID